MTSNTFENWNASRDGRPRADDAHDAHIAWLHEPVRCATCSASYPRLGFYGAPHKLVCHDPSVGLND